MSGKEIKDFIIKKDDLYYNIVVVDENKNNWKFEDIKDNTNYEFTKLEEYVIGCGIVLAYYLIK